ncbi:unnamed protein product [Heligmosomoides polygyrus]|uniref:Reverse transcriptase domain-containing protein n=1 Tax=Heligmosomoides polygyrus TaxID=6339 RepID=A0A183FH18_HELPZ|nr:unnamed protein product [Heligmosomoides polygyrus]
MGSQVTLIILEGRGRRQLHNLRFADDIVLITPSISQPERMLADFNLVCRNVGLQPNVKKTMFMRKRQVSGAPFSLNGTNISGGEGGGAGIPHRERRVAVAFNAARDVNKGLFIARDKSDSSPVQNMHID